MRANLNKLITTSNLTFEKSRSKALIYFYKLKYDHIILIFEEIDAQFYKFEKHANTFNE